MKENLREFIEESIQIELNVGSLYRLFQGCCPDDSSFWWQLSLEEDNHAALIRSGKECFLPVGEFPYDILSESLEQLKKTNKQINEILDSFKEKLPSREEAFNTALKLEESAGEIHYQKFMSDSQKILINEIFQKLNSDDKDHAERIREYMEKHHIQIIT